MLISSLTFTGGWCSEQGHFRLLERQDSLRQAVLYDYNNKSNEKQVKEAVLICSQDCLLLCNSLAWRIPWTEETGGLQSTGLQSQEQLSD